MSGDAWVVLLQRISSECDRVGWWGGEVRDLRDAIGAKRMGARIIARIRARLAEAGYELDGDLSYESLDVIVMPAGTRQLAATVEALLPGIRHWDSQIADAPWRDSLVATNAVGQFLERRAAGGGLPT